MSFTCLKKNENHLYWLIHCIPLKSLRQLRTKNVIFSEEVWRSSGYVTGLVITWFAVQLPPRHLCSFAGHKSKSATLQPGKVNGYQVERHSINALAPYHCGLATAGVIMSCLQDQDVKAEFGNLYVPGREREEMQEMFLIQFGQSHL